LVDGDKKIFGDTKLDGKVRKEVAPLSDLKARVKDLL
jgi:hypothetical protein